MKIQQIKNNFLNSKISKETFIHQMYELHLNFKDYAQNISKTEISKIEIEDNKVIFTTRKTKNHIGGAKFIVDFLDKRTTPLEAFNFDIYESDDANLIFNIGENNQVIIDIGANIGWYSIHLAQKFQQSKIYAFEPIPDTYNQLISNAKLNNLNNVVFNNIALSDNDGETNFYYNPHQKGASSIKNIIVNEHIQNLTIKTQTLDSYIANNNIDKIDFIKCDVEGAELLVFKGGLHSLKKYKPIIFSEMLRKWAAKFNYHPNDIINLLAEIGYACYIFNNNNLEQIKLVDESTIATNYIFLDPIIHAEKLTKLNKI